MLGSGAQRIALTRLTRLDVAQLADAAGADAETSERLAMVSASLREPTGTMRRTS